MRNRLGYAVAVFAIFAGGCSGDGDSRGDGDCAPAAEVCNGADDDCDGSVDEGCDCSADAERACYEGPPATAGVGACHAGAQRCASGRWGECTGAQSPSEEVCNAIDDDCDGAVDESACRWSGVKRIGTPARESLIDLAIDPEGNVRATVSSADYSIPYQTPELDLLLAGFDSAGAPLPVQTFATDRSARMERIAAARDGDGNTYLSLSSWKWAPAELFKLDSTGALLWSVTLVPSNMPEAPSLALDPAGVAHVTVFTDSGWVIRKYDGDGGVLASLPLPPRRTPLSMAIGLDGAIHVTGEARASDGGSDAFVAKLTPDGTPSWEVLIATDGVYPGGFGPPSGSGRRVVVGSTGVVSVVGWIFTYTNPSTDVTFLARYTASGEPVWIHRFPSSSGDAPGTVMATGPGDHLWAASVVGGYPSTARGRLKRYDASGAPVWSLEFGEPSTTFLVEDLVVDAAGDAYVGGYEMFPGAGANDDDVFVAKISPDGVLQ
ncbi:MAG TPA: putative metal-binding motif-containing protein [Anaeromyxobacter sp.]|nr:putative metal-binding motif-containing protein [Anaeromyxobacter sp.]